MKSFSIVVAMDEQRGIGLNGKLPWHIPTELQHFAKLTKTTEDSNKQNAVIMGRKSWESLPLKYRPLPNRLNIVLTRHQDYELPDGTFRAGSLDEALQIAEQQNAENLFVIGGGNVFEEALAHPKCRRLYVTEVQKTFPCDTFLPPIDETQFRIKEVSDLHESIGIFFRFLEYERRFPAE